jgi:transglutaminase-like putative cysteine protease
VTAAAIARLRGWRQWPRDTRDTLFLLAVIGWTMLPHLGHLPAWCSALTAGVLLWRATLAITGRPLPNRWAVLAVLAGALAMTAWTERSLLGREAGVTMLVVLMALKTLELRARRDAMVVFFLGFFLVLTVCLYAQSLLTALAIALSTWGLLTALVLANMPVGRPSLASGAATAARSALLGLPVMAALFVLFPRVGPLWGLPQDSIGRSGLSGTLRMGGVAGVANDDTIAFRIRFDGPTPPLDQLYFRGPVLSRFDGLEWQQSAQAAARPREGRAPGDLATTGAALRYEMLLEPIRLPLLPLLEMTPALAADGSLPAEWAPWLGNDLVWHTARLVNERVRLRTVAWPRHRHGQALNPAEWQAALHLPLGSNPRTVEWARQVRRTLGLQADARTLAAAVQAHIATGGFEYTLQPGAYGRDGVDEFWFDRRQGFCEHFASAFVVVMRAMGVPARIVTGYQGAEPADADGFHIVRQSHAHAWAEYWQPEAGWLRADPTGAVAPERVRASQALPTQPGLVGGALRSVSPALADQLRRGWELLDSRWAQWVMGYSRQRQFGLLQQLGLPHADSTDLLRVLGGLTAAVAAAGAAWAWLDRRRADPWQRRHAALVRRLQRLGLPALPHHPPRTLAALVRQQFGTDGHGLAAALDALDEQRHGRQGQRLPPRAAWQAVATAADSLRTAAPRQGAAARAG